MGHKREFPDFTLDVTIPEGFNDTSWHNDICPSWTHETRNLRLWIEYADPEQREYPDMKRFALTENEATNESEGPKTFIETDDFNDIINYLKEN